MILNLKRYLKKYLMDRKLLELENKLDILKNNYPNVVNLWKKYINVKKKSLLDGIQECETAIKLIEKSDTDLSNKTILLLYMLNNSI